ncbi:MAG: hypothetical protein HYX48_05840 [Chlamydiales bacterium]|nr:hypothetical protein [Chlamydiales bacterium]
MSSETKAAIGAGPAAQLSYLDSLAIRAAQFDVEEARLSGGSGSVVAVNSVALGCIDQLVHFVLRYITYIVYPYYDEFYENTKFARFDSAHLQRPVFQESLYRDATLFIHRFIADPTGIGSLFPSSSGLVAAITRKISEKQAEKPGGIRICEAGAGSGSFTQGIVDKLRPQDFADIIEFDKDLAALLDRKFGHLPNVKIHHVDILKFKQANYDCVVSGLPLNTLSGEFAIAAHDKYEALVNEGGSVSYFEYMLLPRIKQLFLSCFCASADFDRVVNDKARFMEVHNAETDAVYLNMTPAWVQHCTVTLTDDVRNP